MCRSVSGRSRPLRPSGRSREASFRDTPLRLTPRRQGRTARSFMASDSRASSIARTVAAHLRISSSHAATSTKVATALGSFNG